MADTDYQRLAVSCAFCSTPFVGFKTAKFCSRRCGWTAYNRKVSANLAPRPILKCIVCETVFVQPTGLKKYCSERCKVKARSKLLPDGGSVHTRRARKFGVEFHRFDKVDVFERDGWKCGICGISTPRAMRGTREHNSPELDHIIPLSRGGKHVMSNTRCSCRSCNQTKGGMTDEELFVRLAA